MQNTNNTNPPKVDWTKISKKKLNKAITETILPAYGSVLVIGEGVFRVTYIHNTQFRISLQLISLKADYEAYLKKQEELEQQRNGALKKKPSGLFGKVMSKLKDNKNLNKE